MGRHAMTMYQQYSYVLITPARNEAAYIENTILSVISQTVLPIKWVIVSDGSTDETDKIVSSYASTNAWIELVRMPEHRDRQFAAKVHCFNAGYDKLQGLKYDVIGNLDADITFEKDYFEFLLGKFYENPELGVAGTPFVEGNEKTYDYRYTNIEHVSGACQLFRRQCYKEIGGYTPIRGGGIDWVAVTTARMKGWKTQTFTDKVCFHHRPMGTAGGSELGAAFKHGVKDYYLGNHPLWQLFRTTYQITRKPYILYGSALFLGYTWALVRQLKRPVPSELVEFVRYEQMQRLQRFFLKASADKNG